MATRKLAADPLLNTRMKRHLKALGHSSVREYRAWCVDAGFKPQLSKNLGQLEEELQTQKRSVSKSKASSGLSDHIKALGLPGIDQYKTWCRDTGQSDGLYNSVVQRRKHKIRRPHTKQP